MRRKYRWLIVITAGAAAVRLAHLGRGSIRLNELITLELIRRYNAIELVIAVPSEQPHLPLYYVALDVWVGLVGTTPPAMRLLSVMAGVLAVPAIYLLGRAMYDDTTGLIAAVLVALSRLQISQSQQARMYTLVVLLTIVSYYVFYERIRGHVPASLALIVTHPFGVLPVISQLAAGWSRRLSRSDYPNAVWGSRPADMVLGGLLVPVLAGLGTLAAGRMNPRLSPPSIRTIGEAVVVFFLSGGRSYGWQSRGSCWASSLLSAAGQPGRADSRSGLRSGSMNGSC